MAGPQASSDAFGVVAIAMRINGRSEVRDDSPRRGSPPPPDAAELTGGALEPGQAIEPGAQARQFATIMEHHALESTSGKRYAEMGRFLTPSGEETNDEAADAKGPNDRPVENGHRNLRVTETALSTALNMSYMAEQLALFGIVVGFALLLTGIGFLVLAIGGTSRRGEARSTAVARHQSATATG
ncbi:MAG: hypothetical protein ABIR67_08740 [Gaiellaceae bacterium]